MSLLTRTQLLDYTQPMLPEQGNCWSLRSGIARASGLVVAPNGSSPASQVDLVAVAVALDGPAGYAAATEVSLTCSMTATGANGHEVTANLAGTVSSSGTAVTGSGTSFLAQYTPGDVLRCTSGSQSGNGRRVTVVASDTAMTLESAFGSDLAGETFARGGEAPNTWYALHVIGDLSGELPVASLLSTRLAPTLPAGYGVRGHVGGVRNDGSSDLVPFRQIGQVHSWDEMQQVMSVTADAAFTTRGVLAPGWATRALLEVRAETDGASTGAVSTLVRRTGSSASVGCLRAVTPAVEDHVDRVVGWAPLTGSTVEIKSGFPSGASGVSSAHLLAFELPFLAS